MILQQTAPQKTYNGKEIGHLHLWDVVNKHFGLIGEKKPNALKYNGI